MGTSTTCGGCVHHPKRLYEDPCSRCWDGRSAYTLWEAPMAHIPNADGTPPITAAQAVVRQATVAGRKDDSGKLDVTLFFDDLPHAIEAVTEVLQWAITKKQPEPYKRGSWQGVEDFSRRYRGALLRHQLNRAKTLTWGHPPGYEPVDAETDLLELAHIATDAMFLLEMAVRKRKGIAVPEGA